MTISLAATEFTGSPSGPDRPALILGPSLGTTATSLWGRCAELLAGDFQVIGWDLPGHGSSAPAVGFDIPALGEAVLGLADRVGVTTFHYAGDSVGGAVGLQLALDAPERVTTATVACTGAMIGTPADWSARAATVRAAGTAALVESASARWFSPGFESRCPEVAAGLLTALAETDDESYAAVCDALARFDIRDRLADISTPVLAVAGELDRVCPPVMTRRIADGVQYGRAETLAHVAHLAPAEDPEGVAQLIGGFIHRAPPRRVDAAAVRAAGMRIRREVLGDDHVDRASAGTDPFTSDFQDLITRYAWGTVWARPGLDRRSRSMITLTALVAGGHQDELALHVRAALTNGLTVQEITEVLLQSAVYCGVPAANTAFKIAREVLAEADSDISES